jgi:hypothetical protein
MAYLAILKMFSLGANQCSQSSYTLCFCKYIDTIVNTVKPRTDKQVFLDNRMCVQVMPAFRQRKRVFGHKVFIVK